jgi:hypothetical protein
MSKQPAPVNSTETTKDTAPEKPVRRYGFFENAAVWLLSRLPWFNTRYQQWSKGKRVFIGLLMYLICLPVIPIVIGIVLYIHDPEGFKKGNASKILAGVIVVWLGFFGLLGMQPSMPDNPLNGSAKVDQFNREQKAAPEANQIDNTDAAPASAKSEARKSVQSKSDSADTKGRYFKNCDAAYEVGVFNIPKSDASYQSRLDRDNDGVACEK